MSDPSTSPAPQVLTTTTGPSPTPAQANVYQPVSAAPPTDPTPVQSPTPEESPAGYEPDLVSLQNANGDTKVWAHEFSELIGHITGRWIDEASIEDWMNLLAQQVSNATMRSAMFQIANTPLPTTQKGDAALLMLQLRNDLSAALGKAAGL